VPTPGDPTQLVGSWLLTAPGAEPGTVLRIGDDLSLWSSCGTLFGTWAASRAGLFDGYLSGGSPACPAFDSNHGPSPAWLLKVAAFTTDATGAELLDSTGAVVATLRPGGHPTAGPDLLASLADPPTLTDDLRARLKPAAALPAGLVAARPDQLLGYWQSQAKPLAAGFAQLAPDGSWTGSDGANDWGGRWSAAPDGELVVVAGATTAAACGGDNCADPPSSFTGAARAAFDGTTLVLLDADGHETGRLVNRTPPIIASPTGSYAAPPVSSQQVAASSVVASPVPAVSASSVK
jgi:hypothetical protein